MKFNNIQSCHIGPEISAEQFVPEHFFLFLLKGSMQAFDGHKKYKLEEGDFCLIRKNHLIRYTKIKKEGAFEKVLITFDDAFLKKFTQRHHIISSVTDNIDSLVFSPQEKLIRNFIASLEPYYNGSEQLDATFSDVKREELLLILLKDQYFAAIPFNFGIPQKINLEEFMNHNFRFNVSLERFAYLTGRSLSTFKRDFQKAFGMNPGQWLTGKRLEESYFLIRNQGRKPSDFYIDLGFEDFSHFSFAFKKRFGRTPKELSESLSVPT